MPVPTYKAKSLPQLLEIRAAEQPDDPAVYTGAPEFGTEFKTLTYSHLLRAVDRLAHHYAPLSLLAPGPSPPEQVIAILTSTAIDMFLLESALTKIGLAPFLLSINNSVSAVAHLCKITGSTHLIYGPRYEEAAKEAKEILEREGIELGLVEDKRFPLWGEGGVDDEKTVIYPFKARFTPDEQARRTAVILHSSGSMSFPKPNFMSHFGSIAILASGLTQAAFSALPLYHGLGHATGFRCIYNGVPFTLFFPHIPLTGPNVIKCIQESPRPANPQKDQQLAAVPYVIKLLAESDAGVEILASFAGVSYAGAALPDDLGDRLTAAGVNIFSIYGTTETGAVMNSKRDYDTDKAWNWVRAEGLIEHYHSMEDRGSGTFEMIVLDGFPSKIVSNRPDGSYATNDLFIRHPEHPNWYKYVGRLDDTITQILGEKTNPLPMELAIRGNSPYVQECIVFGDGRPQVGCLLLPTELAKDVWQDRKQYMELVWPVIAQANAQAPTHSRILPEMIEILPPGTAVPVATKMSILRPACYKKFALIIDAVYDRVEHGTGAAKQVIDNQAEMEKFLTETIVSTLGNKAKEITPSTDLFAYGIDSLQATRVRNVVSKSLDLGGITLGQNVVYEHPSISKLAAYLLAVRSGGDGVKTDAQQGEVMRELVEKWAKTLDTTASSSAETTADTATGEVVVLTGATGSLGAHILDQLTNDPSVAKVICLSRAKSHADSLVRIKDSLKLRKRSLSPTAFAKIVSFAADVNEPLTLGLLPEEYETLRREATIVIHNAWPVNFVLSIESFDVHIGGAVNLLNLTLRSPRATVPRYYFSSSVATRNGRFDSPCPETFPDVVDTASKLGYGRSKWVVEKLCERAAEISRAQVGVLRIGQLCGDTENGVWTETEAWPLMMKSTNVIGALPILNEHPSWLPVNLAAKCIKELVLTPKAPKAAVYHVLNPNTSWSWDAVLEGMRQGGVKFDAVDRLEWLKRLRESNPDVEANPTFKLLGYYTGRLSGEKDKETQIFSVHQTSLVSPTIASCPPITANMVALWAKHWRETGFLA